MKFLFKIYFVIACFNLTAQNQEPLDPNYFQVPMKIPVFLAGNFGELRPNHFHAGIDIKTQGRTGLPVFAAADGFVSRISISPTGYGKVLYLDHPNGTTTVYGHLDSFSPAIDNYIRNLQYEKETFAIDQTVPPDLLPVKKGEQIAKSGNSGSSGGPHLHFEVRRTVEQLMLNPLLFNIPVKDKAKPVIQSVVVYPVSKEATVAGKQDPLRLEAILSGNSYKLKTDQIIQVSGKIGFGIQAIDLLDGATNKCGIYSLQLSIDNTVIYSFKMDDYAISESKYVNVHIDYERAIRSGQRLYKTWIEPGNKLGIYDEVVKHAIFKADDNQLHDVKFVVADVAGNTSTIAFKIKSTELEMPKKEPKGELFRYNHGNRIKTDEIEFSVPEGALYNDVDFIFEKKPALPKLYSAVYQLHNPYTALHFACPLRIKAENLPERLQPKAMLAQVDPVSGRIYSATGKFVDGWVEGNIRVLGNYALAVDTIAPKISPLPFTDKKTKKTLDKIQIKISDNLSGIETYRGTLDGKWILFEYDLKNNLLSYTFDKKRIQFGKTHKLELSVTDYKGNVSTFKTNILK